MRRAYPLSLVAVVGFVAVVVRADDFWLKKDWQKWNAAECRKMLTDSPWSKTFSMPIGQLQNENRTPQQIANTKGNGNIEANENLINYYVELRSAEPVREATIRQQEIARRYDAMSEKDRAQIDSQASEYISRDFKDTILVHVIYECLHLDLHPELCRTLANNWQSIPEGKVPLNAFLDVEGGKQVQPLRFVSSTGAVFEFDLYFPRTINGEPIIGSADKEVSVEFTHPALDNLPAQRVFVTFKLDKMVSNGRLTY